MISAETVLAAEWIVKYDNFAGAVRVLLWPCEKKSESERAFVSGAQGISEAWAIMRRVGIAKINRVLVNDDLIVCIRRTAAVVGRRRDSETRIYALQVVIDALTVGRDDLAGMGVKLLASKNPPEAVQTEYTGESKRIISLDSVRKNGGGGGSRKPAACCARVSY